MRNNQIVAAIDIGSASIVAALAKIAPEGEIIPIAFAQIPSKGVKKGGIVNIALVQHAVSQVLDELQVDGSYHIHSIVASLSGVTVVGYNADGSVEVRGDVISEHNVMQVVAAAKAVSSSQGRHLLHILRQDFMVDRQTDIDNPIGLRGEKLSIRVHVISVAKTAYHNLQQVFYHHDIDVDYVVASGLASALAVASPDEKRLGVCVLDIGAGTTDVTVVHNGVIKHTDIIPVGGELITSDVAFFMRTTLEKAEAVKRSIDISSHYSDEDTIEMAGLSEVSRHYGKREIAGVIRERCDQLMDIVLQKLSRAGVEECIPGGFIICGGSANLAGLSTALMQRSQLPVRTAKVKIPLKAHDKKDSCYAAIMGLFVCAYEEDFTRTVASERKTGIIGSLGKQMADLLGRLRRQF